MRGLEILEKIKNGLKNGKIGLRSADIGRYGPAPAKNKIFIGKILYFNKKAHSAGNRAVTVSK